MLKKKSVLLLLIVIHWQVVYELPCPAQWSFDVQWCPRNPNMICTPSFDGHISIYSLMGGGVAETSGGNQKVLCTNITISITIIIITIIIIIITIIIIIIIIILFFLYFACVFSLSTTPSISLTHLMLQFNTRLLHKCPRQVRH